MLVFASKARTALEVESGVCSAILVLLSLQVLLEEVEVLVEVEKEVTTERLGVKKLSFWPQKDLSSCCAVDCARGGLWIMSSVARFGENSPNGRNSSVRWRWIFCTWRWRNLVPKSPKMGEIRKFCWNWPFLAFFNLRLKNFQIYSDFFQPFLFLVTFSIHKFKHDIKKNFQILLQIGNVWKKIVKF